MRRVKLNVIYVYKRIRMFESRMYDLLLLVLNKMDATRDNFNLYFVDMHGRAN